MSIYSLNLILAEAPANQGQGGTGLLPMLGYMAPMLVIFYFLMIRPQQKKAKEHAQMLTRLKSGDHVVTNSGIIGTVVNVKEKAVTVRTAGDTKLEFTKGAISEIVTDSDSKES